MPEPFAGRYLGWIRLDPIKGVFGTVVILAWQFSLAAPLRYAEMLFRARGLPTIGGAVDAVDAVDPRPG